MKKIYKTYLIKENACREQVKLFNKHYPKGIHVCADCFADAQNLGLNVYWLKRFLYSEYGLCVAIFGRPSYSALQSQFVNNHTFISHTLLRGLIYNRRLVSAEGLRILARELLDVKRKR